MSENVIEAVGGRVILFRKLMEYDLKMGYLELIKSDIIYETAIKQYNEDKKNYKIIIAYNCFDNIIVGTGRMCLKTKKIDNIYLIDELAFYGEELKLKIIELLKTYNFDRIVFL